MLADLYNPIAILLTLQSVEVEYKERLEQFCHREKVCVYEMLHRENFRPGICAKRVTR